MVRLRAVFTSSLSQIRPHLLDGVALCPCPAHDISCSVLKACHYGNPPFSPAVSNYLRERAGGLTGGECLSFTSLKSSFKVSVCPGIIPTAHTHTFLAALCCLECKSAAMLCVNKIIFTSKLHQNRLYSCKCYCN